MSKFKIDLKPLSVNGAWNTFCLKCRSAKIVKRTKTKQYKDYEKNMLLLLPKNVNIYDKNELIIEYGFSNKLSDVDNPCKLLVDIMQKKYNFNDATVYKITQVKTIVKKGNEFIKVEIKKYEKD